jgi:hypothetical protein
MHGKLQIAVFFLLTCIAFAQTSPNSSSDSHLVWQPPTLQLPETQPRFTVSKEMMTTLRFAKMPIALEKTPLGDVEKRLGGNIGRRGDASDALAWLCFNGRDGNAAWALWLESSELGGEIIDGYALQRLDQNARVDQRCRTFGKSEGEIDLSVALRLGATEMQVRKILGTPTAVYGNTLVFAHRHQQDIGGEPFTVSNTVYITLRAGTVWTIQVWKDTVS